MDIRKLFLDYFKKNDHLILPSSSLIPDNDTSVLLTTAGMQQFKPYYLGIKKPPKPRIATVQKCFRTSDIEKVGYTGQHLTFFEMLGNFAFADYFKKEAINFAMEFVLKILKLPIEKLSVGVFAGDNDIPPDDEAYNLWKKLGIAENRIYKFGKSENFWGPAGETGPCGPCTEIYFDFGKNFGCKRENCSPSCDCGRFLEIWNLVFTQYNFNGVSYEELPNKNIDTGMGLERICAVLNGYPSVFNTYLFKDIISKIQELSSLKINFKEIIKESNEDNNLKLQKLIDENLDMQQIQRCVKIIADHSRAVTFLIADGILPSNESRGYILRRIIRRAIRFGKLIKIENNFLSTLSEVVINNYHEFYPEIKEKSHIIFEVLNDEENKFLKTLIQGSKMLTRVIAEIKDSNKKFIEPKDAFKLYETYGFPIELTTEILNENNVMLDVNKLNEYIKMHSEKSREKTIFNKKIDLNLKVYKTLVDELVDEFQNNFEVEFTGYFNYKQDSTIKAILKLDEKNIATKVSSLSVNQRGEIILDKTPFYPEKGGAIGDKGIIKLVNNKFLVEDTQTPIEGLIVHRGIVLEGEFKVGDNVISEVDINFRKNVSKNHTATHILHWALRLLLDSNVKQAGSFVADNKFRFDYITDKAPSNEELEKLEKIINEKIQQDDIVRCFETTLDYAKEIGAVALFEEKYKKYVRVVEINNYSRELCGGIHVKRTGEIGIFKILSDSSIGQNIRRIEAVTGINAYVYLNDVNKKLISICKEIDCEPENAVEKIKELKEEFNKLNQDLISLQIKAIKLEILSNGRSYNINNTKIIFYDLTKSKFNLNINAKKMGIIGDDLINSVNGQNIFIALYNLVEGKSIMLLQCSKSLSESGLNCNLIVKELTKVIRGGGGGKPQFAQIGGFNANLLDDAFNYIYEYITNFLKNYK